MDGDGNAGSEGPFLNIWGRLALGMVGHQHWDPAKSFSISNLIPVTPVHSPGSAGALRFLLW